MPNYRLLCFTAAAVLFTASAHAQVRARIKAADSAELKVIRVYPDSFPQVRVVLKAVTPSGRPVWNLQPSQIRVTENDAQGKVINLRMISRNRPMCISLVVDHSESMRIDNNQLYDPDGLPLFKAIPRDKVPKEFYLRKGDDIPIDSNTIWIEKYPEGYVMPLTSAQIALGRFLRTVNFKKDLVSLTGFSNSPDMTNPLTADSEKVMNMIRGMRAEGQTAFYDAMWTGLDELNNANGIRAMVAMTDGLDNRSVHTLKQVIARARKMNIPVFVVGLGDVNKEELGRLARKTDGFFYYAKDARDLPDIYQTISRNLKAVYELQYESPNLHAADTSRNFSISFHVEDIYLKQNVSRLDLPEEVIERLHELEDRQAPEVTTKITPSPSPSPDSTTNPWLVGGLIVTVGVAGAGSLAVKFGRNLLPNNSSSTPATAASLQNIYPNPASTQATVELSAANNADKIQLMDMNGRVVKEIPVAAGSTSANFSVSDLQDGQYIVRMQGTGGAADSLKLIVQK